jgi:putative membrane protein
MRALLIRWLINTLAIYLAVHLVPGVRFTSGPAQILLVAALFGLVNATVKPILAMLTCPLVMLTLGLFLFVINALMLLLLSWLSSRLHLGFAVDGFSPAFVAGLLISVVSFVLSLLVGEKEVRVRRLGGSDH